MFKFKFRRKRETQEQKEYVDKQVRKLPKFVSAIFLIYVIIFICFMIWYFTFRSTYVISDVEGPSMSPTINIGVADNDAYTKEDFVYVNKKKEVEREDIVVVNLNTTGDSKNDNLIIKRAVALGGDKITIRIAEDGFYHVFIQYAGEEEVMETEESYIKSYEGWTRSKSTYVKSSIYYENEFYNTFLMSGEDVTVIDGVYFYEVPEGKYICLGDNRAVSRDSRNRGAFSESQMQGVAQIIVKDGCKSSGLGLFFKKVGSICNFYWKEIEKSLIR